MTSGRRDRAGLADVASELARSLRSGSTLPIALVELRPPAVWAGDLERVRDLVERGVPVVDALRAWRDARDREEVCLLVAACETGHRHGGDPARALDGVAATLRDRAELAEEARALTAQARAAVAVLGALPLVGAASFSLLDPRVAGVLLGTGIGWACLVAGACLDAAGVALSAHLVRRALR